MGLNIKNERVHELAREVARRTGRNQTSAIEVALERFVAELDAERSDAARIDLIHSMQQATAERALDADELYDAEGLPR